MLPRVARFAACVAWAILVGSTLTPPARAQCPDYGTGPRWVGSADVEGIPDDLAIVGSHAYAAWGMGFAVFDITNPQRPTLVSRISAPNYVRAVAISGTSASLACGVGLSVVDISNPTQPVLRGSVDTFGRNPQDVAISGSYAYVADGLYGVGLVDITDPFTPKLVKGIDTPGFDYDVDVEGTDVFVAAGTAGLWVFTWSNPLRPVFLGSVDTPGDARGLARVGDFAYVADGTGLVVIDVQDRRSPSIVGAVDTPEAGRTTAVTVAGDYAYITGDRHLVVVDISDPRTPRIVGLADVQARAIAVSGIHAYVGGSRLEVFDISQPVSTAPAGQAFAFDSRRDLADIEIAGSYAYVTDYGWNEDPDRDGGLRIIDVSDPADVRLVGQVDASGGYSQSVVSGAHAFVVGGGGMRVYDVSAPTSPALVGTLGLGSWTTGIAVSGSIACVSDATLGFQIVDISNPSIPARLGGIEALAPAGGVALDGNIAYVMGRDHLVTVDVTDPAAPVVADSIGVCGAFAISGSFACVADVWGSFVVIDISNPRALAVAARIPGRFRGVAIAGSLAYVTNDYGLVLIDISTPAAPEVVGAAPEVSSPLGISGSSIYGTLEVNVVQRWGLRVLPLPCESTPIAVSDLSATAADGGIVLRWSDDSNAFVDFAVLRCAEDDTWPRLGAAARTNAGWEFTDATVVPGAAYAYRIEGHLPDGSMAYFGPVRARALPAGRFALGPVRPFPARESATVSYTMAAAEAVHLEVLDARGRRVRLLVDGERGAGPHSVTWDGLDARGIPVGSGLYFVRLAWPGGSRVTRAAFLR